MLGGVAARSTMDLPGGSMSSASLMGMSGLHTRDASGSVSGYSVGYRMPPGPSPLRGGGGGGGGRREVAPPSRAAALREQLLADMALLRNHGLMDYSVILMMAPVVPGGAGSNGTRTEGSGGAASGGGSSGGGSSGGGSGGITRAASGGSATSDETLMLGTGSAVGVAAAAGAGVPSTRATNGSGAAAAASAPLRGDGRYEYYLMQVGVIDVLQAFNGDKRLERNFKQSVYSLSTCRWDAPLNISAIDAPEYATRFGGMVRAAFRDADQAPLDDGELETGGVWFGGDRYAAAARRRALRIA